MVKDDITRQYQARKQMYGTLSVIGRAIDRFEQQDNTVLLSKFADTPL